MPEVIFSHPKVKDGNQLTIHTGANQFEWSYGLNTVTYDTYGGEVVQILSAFVDDVTISGQCRDYAEMERIYSWFVEYIQVATQGGSGLGSFNPDPVTMTYPYRDWTLQIIPTQLPGLRWGRDVVAPEWQITASVYEEDPEMAYHTRTAAELGIGDFGKLTADIGYDPDNPFSAPVTKKTKEGKFDPSAVNTTKYADQFNQIIQSYTQGNFDAITAQFGSFPSFLSQAGKNSQQTVK